MAVRLKEKIEEATKLKLWVQAVVVIWGDFRAEPVEQDNVVYLRGKDLVPWLGSRPKRLSPRSQNLVTLAVQAELVAPPFVERNESASQPADAVAQ